MKKNKNNKINNIKYIYILSRYIINNFENMI
jgi:hypothetical protein